MLLLENHVLAQPGAKGTKHFSVRREGNVVISTSWTDAKKPRESVQTLGDEKAALDATLKAIRAKLRADFVYVAPTPPADGGLLFVARTWQGDGSAFDVDARGLTVFLDSRSSVAFIRTDSGLVIRRDTGRDKPIHAGMLDGGGTVAHYASGESLVSHMTISGEERVVSAYCPYKTPPSDQLPPALGADESDFNSHCVEPRMDAASGRIVAPAPGNRLAVLELPEQSPWSPSPWASLRGSCAGPSASPRPASYSPPIA